MQSACNTQELMPLHGVGSEPRQERQFMPATAMYDRPIRTKAVSNCACNASLWQHSIPHKASSPGSTCPIDIVPQHHLTGMPSGAVHFHHSSPWLVQPVPTGDGSLPETHRLHPADCTGGLCALHFQPASAALPCTSQACNAGN